MESIRLLHEIPESTSLPTSKSAEENQSDYQYYHNTAINYIKQKKYHLAGLQSHRALEQVQKEFKLGTNTEESKTNSSSSNSYSGTLPHRCTAEILYGTAISQLLSGDPEGALNYFEKITAEYGRKPVYWIRMAECCIQCHVKELARKENSQLITVCGSHSRGRRLQFSSPHSTDTNIVHSNRGSIDNYDDVNGMPIISLYGSAPSSNNHSNSSSGGSSGSSSVNGSSSSDGNNNGNAHNGINSNNGNGNGNGNGIGSSSNDSSCSEGVSDSKSGNGHANGIIGSGSSSSSSSGSSHMSLSRAIRYLSNALFIIRTSLTCKNSVTSQSGTSNHMTECNTTTDVTTGLVSTISSTVPITVTATDTDSVDTNSSAVKMQKRLHILECTILLKMAYVHLELDSHLLAHTVAREIRRFPDADIPKQTK